MRKNLNGILALVGCLLLIASLSTAAWRYPVESGLTTGDLIYASGQGELGAINAVATGYVLASAGAGTVPAYTATPTVTSITAAKYVATSVTVSPTGTGDYTLSPSNRSLVYLNNASNFEVIISETSAVDGQELEIINCSNGTAGFSDSAGVLELTASSVTLGIRDVLKLRYVTYPWSAGTSQWIETGASNN